MKKYLTHENIMREVTKWVCVVLTFVVVILMTNYDFKMEGISKPLKMPVISYIFFMCGYYYIFRELGKFVYWNFNPDNYVEMHRFYGKANGEWSAKGFSIDALDLYNSENDFKWIASNDEHPFNLYPHTKKGEPLTYSEE